MRKVIHALSDIKILLTNVFSREYIFESLQQDKKIQTKDTLGADLIREFLKSIIHLIVSNTSPEAMNSIFDGSKSLPSILTFKKNLKKVGSIVLRQFMADKKDQLSKQSESQRILREMLLDLIVEQLEKRCYIKSKVKDE